MASDLSSAEQSREAEAEKLAPTGNNGCGCGLFGGSSGYHRDIGDLHNSPDADFHADSLIKLSHGVTAYRLIEPRENGRSVDDVPVIMCLHGLQNCSYMWADIADLLSDFEQGPQAKVLVFDFYGRGRSPWTGVNITLDTLVTQTKELMDFLGLTNAKHPVSLIGYDMGGAVAVGFAAKYPTFCRSLSLIAPLGIKYKQVLQEKLLHRKYIGEFTIFKQRKQLPFVQEFDYYDRAADSPHRYLIDKQMDMTQWQIKHTPGYLGAILSTYRFFPLRGMEELFAAIGRHPRKVMIAWGDHDNICPYKKCMKVVEESFPNGNIVDVLDCGHNVVAEKFEEIVRELLSFTKEVSDGKLEF